MCVGACAKDESSNTPFLSQADFVELCRPCSLFLCSGVYSRRHPWSHTHTHIFYLNPTFVSRTYIRTSLSAEREDPALWLNKQPAAPTDIQLLHSVTSFSLFKVWRQVLKMAARLANRHQLLIAGARHNSITSNWGDKDPVWSYLLCQRWPNSLIMGNYFTQHDSSTSLFPSPTGNGFISSLVTQPQWMWTNSIQPAINQFIQ